MNLAGQRVLVTGAGGFVGSHLAEALVDAGCHVRALVRYRSTGSRGWLDRSGQAHAMEFVAGDVRDQDSVARAVQDCSVVFHLAALIGIPYSYVSPEGYLRTNVDGSFHVLEAARRSGVARVIVTSTSEVYGTAQRVPIDEAHPIHPQSPYAATKAAADHLAVSYHHAFDMPVTVVRPFNTYGPRQSARAVIPAIAAQVLAGSSLVRLGNLDPTRDFTFVSDTVAGFLAAASSDAFVGRAVHIGTGEEISCRDLALTIARLAGREVELVEDKARKRPSRSEVARLVCDSGALRTGTGWRPVVALEEGLTRTLDWLGRNRAWFRGDEYSL
jgi:dTDP-glucose 4,6-dehydratase